MLPSQNTATFTTIVSPQELVIVKWKIYAIINLNNSIVWTERLRLPRLKALKIAPL